MAEAITTSFFAQGWGDLVAYLFLVITLVFFPDRIVRRRQGACLIMRRLTSILILLVAVLVVLPGILSAVGGGYWFRVVTTIGVFSILTMSANLITGTTA